MINDIILTCIKEKNKLRIKIITPGYYNDANCQFPKNIREEGMKYIVPNSDITLACGSNGKYFYRIKKTNIRKCKYSEVNKVFDVDNDPCVICLTNNKKWVIIPCGHYILCDDCNDFLIGTEQKCPICRGIIMKTIKYTEIS